MEEGNKMGQIDSSIYFQSQGPDVVGNLQRGLALRDMMDERSLRNKELNENEAIKSAYAQGIKQGPDGKQYLDQNATLSAIAKVNPMKAYEQQKAFEVEDIQRQKQDIEKKLKSIDLGSRILSGVTDQSSFDKAIETGQKFGFDVSGLGKYYDPDLVKQYQSMSMTGKEKLDDQYNQLDYKLKERAADLADKRLISDNSFRNKQLEQKRREGSGYSAGQKKLDQEFAKDYNEWTSGKSNSARLEINKLQDVATKLEKGNLSTGGFSGMFPDRMTSSDLLSARADVQSTVMNSLKALLGSQFTEKEGARVISNTWNEADSTEHNLERLNRLITDLNSQADAKDQKAKYYEKTGKSLAGFVNESKVNETLPTSRKTYKTDEIDWK